MQVDQLKPDIIIRGAFFSEPVQIITTVQMGESGFCSRMTLVQEKPSCPDFWLKN
jgi:hypothetical protein